MLRRSLVRAAPGSAALAMAHRGGVAASVARLAWVPMDGKSRPSYNFTAFRKGLRSWGWIEGMNPQLDPWLADGAMARCAD